MKITLHKIKGSLYQIWFCQGEVCTEFSYSHPFCYTFLIECTFYSLQLILFQLHRFVSDSSKRSEQKIKIKRFINLWMWNKDWWMVFSFMSLYQNIISFLFLSQQWWYRDNVSDHDKVFYPYSTHLFRFSCFENSKA